ncbi:hypothetical protein QA641_37760 [Bradyrhizobium sp. CB1650]|uniref:hypothetical protein n=1 Tax=Bradyrhizobium sp. CB1650 TaxID=3039153 RepID=UPI0024353751|nr:hypothetical protein [Bradyrhizobium sp. CB1650]WGD51181.1 hypothetical protein QA641_37760 [Bradyrhizobium sp. CB1650]
MQHQRHRAGDLLDLYIGAKRALEQAITALNAGAAGPRQRIRCRLKVCDGGAVPTHPGSIGDLRQLPLEMRKT